MSMGCLTRFKSNTTHWWDLLIHTTHPLGFTSLLFIIIIIMMYLVGNPLWSAHDDPWLLPWPPVPETWPRYINWWPVGASCQISAPPGTLSLGAKCTQEFYMCGDKLNPFVSPFIWKLIYLLRLLSHTSGSISTNCILMSCRKGMSLSRSPAGMPLSPWAMT